MFQQEEINAGNPLGDKHETAQDALGVGPGVQRRAKALKTRIDAADPLRWCICMAKA